MSRLGKQQMWLLCGLGSPGTALVVPDKLSNGLVARGLRRRNYLYSMMVRSRFRKREA
jgi:hypothetical protein